MSKSDEKEQPQPEECCSRREFIRRAGMAGAATAAALAFGFGLHRRESGGLVAPMSLPDFSARPEPNRPRVAAIRADNIEQALRALLDRLGGIERFVSPGDVVLLKPNAGFATPPSVGATTNPAVVEAVARICLAAGAAEVRVAENSINDPERCMDISGIAAAARAAGARVFLPRPSAFQDVETPECAVLKRWSFFYEPFRGATRVIGLPAAKHHSLAGATLGMKNWYGLLGGRRNQLHQDINTSIADLATMVRPTLTILDATRVLIRNGPTGGSLSDVRHDGILAAAVDPVALDTYGASLLGRTPEELPFLVEAQRRGLGTSDLKEAGFEMIGGAKTGGTA